VTVVSVIVPAYNYARFLPDALESVLAQTFEAWECVVVDDGSEDETAEVAERYVRRDSRFHYVRQENKGPSAARNLGLASSRGELVQFLDADDRLLPRKLEEHVSFLRAHPETDIVYSEVGFFASERPSHLSPSLGGKLSQSIMGRVQGVDDAREKLQHYCIMPILAAMVRRSVFARAGTFDEGFRTAEDYAFWIRCAAAGCRFDYLPASALAAVRTHAASSSRDTLKMVRGLIAASKAWPDSPAARQWPGGDSPLIYQVAGGYDLIDRGRRREGVRRIWRAAGYATEPLTGWRWRVYALAGAVLPRAWFLRFVSIPIPEAPFELYRRLRRFL
jgi:glycosyltransferase involved in cell wall biosynthesis